MSKQQPQMSRRDWFRLRSPASPPAKQQRLGAEPPAGLQSINEPVNHGSVDLSALPPMHEAILNAQEVAALFEDLEHHANSVQLIVRRVADNATDQSARLSTACSQLLNGNVAKLQIRYHWQDAHWIDTLHRQPEGFRLVRIRHA